MTGVVSEIKTWAKELPYWEQVALDKILGGHQCTDDDYDELLEYLLEDAGLVDRKGKRPPFRILNSTSHDTQFTAGPIRLEKIFNMNNINALVPGQTLTFCPTLTAIYGATGSGKSGYSRVLGCAGFTRGDKEVFPDLTKPVKAHLALSADIEIFDGSSNRVINYRVGAKCADLAQCYVFDSTSVRVHLLGSNAFSFSPAGLSQLTQLSNVTDCVRKRLSMRIDQHSQPRSFLAFFPGKSPIAEFVKKLGPGTDLDELSRFAALTSKNRKRMRELEREIAALQAKDIPKEIARISQATQDLTNLKQKILSAERALNDEAIKTTKDAVDQYLVRESMAERISVDQFQIDRFTQIGTDVWHHFIESAKALAIAESLDDTPYPQVGDYCLLCHQPLSPQAHEFLMRLLEYLQSDAQSKLEQYENVLSELRHVNDLLDLDFFTNQSISYRLLEEHDASLVPSIEAFVESCRVRRSLLNRLIDTRQSLALPSLPNDHSAELQQLISKLETQRRQLEVLNPAQRIVLLSQELLTLQHRMTLHQYFDDIAGYVKNRKWAESASALGGDTRHITAQYKKLFGKLVTNRYLDLFKQMLRDLQHPLNVKVQTIGRKGKTYKQIVLQLDKTALSEIATPEKVLSEGEKRAVALADFLTEVALDTASSSIILDDPVTSLDLEWREMIASILAKEAKVRQVIVFTHDLPFLYFMKKHAEINSIQIMTHWIQRIKDQPGYVSLNNSPALEREYQKTVRSWEYYKKANDSSGIERADYLSLGFGSLRTCYEAFVVFDLFEGVVLRFDERISFARLRNIKWDDSIIKEANSKYELLSKYIEGHLHTNGYVDLSDPQLLRREIEAFEGLRKRLRQLKKS